MNPVELAYQHGYRATETGEVIGTSGIVLRLRANRDGYLYFGIRVGGKKHTVRAHRLQAFQKFGDAIFQPGIEVRHHDGNQQNNRADNLILGTKVENAADKTSETKLRAALAGADAVRKHDHASILTHYRIFGFTQTARDFGLSKGTFAFILRKSRAAQMQEAA